MTIWPSPEIIEIGARTLAGLGKGQEWPTRLQSGDASFNSPDVRFHEAMTLESEAFLQAIGPILASDTLRYAADLIENAGMVDNEDQFEDIEGTTTFVLQKATYKDAQLLRALAVSFRAMKSF